MHGILGQCIYARNFRTVIFKHGISGQYINAYNFGTVCSCKEFWDNVLMHGILGQCIHAHNFVTVFSCTEFWHSVINVPKYGTLYIYSRIFGTVCCMRKHCTMSNPDWLANEANSK
jgi:hypothetical protein